MTACLFIDVDNKQLRRNRAVGDLMDERSICAVLKQTPDEVSQQVPKLANRCIDAHAHVRLIGKQSVVQRIAHAVQTLELVAPAACASGKFPRELENRCDGQRIVSSELRVDGRRVAQQPACHRQE